MFAVLAANMFGIDLSIGDLIMLVITTVLASIGAGGVPGGSLMKWWTRSHRIGTLAEMEFQVALLETAEPPKYQQIAEKKLHLNQLGDVPPGFVQL